METKNELTITRIFDAPAETVWKYWTEPEYFKKWWGPKDFTCPEAKIDFRVDGKHLSCMRGSPKQGAPVQDFWSTGTYKEIVPMKKIVVTDSFADERGNIVPSTHYGMKGFPLEMLVTVTFEELEGNRTKMTLAHSGIQSINQTDRSNMEQGWNQSFDKLAENLKTEKR